MVTNNTLKLQYPVTVNGVTYETLQLRRMKARDALIGEGETNQLLSGYKIFAALADVDVEVIKDLDMEDFNLLAEVAAPLMGKQAEQALKNIREKPSAGET